MARSPSFMAVILAAGASSRMGRDKALLAWHGTTFLGAAIESLRPYSELVMVVAGNNAEELRPVVDGAGAFLLVNPQPERGQFSSLRAGLQQVLSYGRDAALVTLVDRPPPQSATIALLLAEFLRTVEQGTWAVVPEHAGQHGHPIVVGREMMEAFLRAPADSTARDVQHQHASHVRYVAVEDAGVVLNVDAPEDYARIKP